MASKAVLLMSYGTPEKEEDVEPYLKDIFHGREVPLELVEEIKEKYKKIGFSPLKSITIRQAAMLQKSLILKGQQGSVFIGMKHWNPKIEQAADSILKIKPSKVVGIVVHPFKSVAGSDEYKERFLSAFKGIDSVFIDEWYLEKSLYDAWSSKIREEMERNSRSSFFVIFTSHGLPVKVNDEYYRKQLEEFSKDLAHSTGIADYSLAYQNGEHKDWYSPEVRDEILKAKSKGFNSVLLVPIGYISESLETLYDIDIVYRKFAAEHGINLQRVKCPNDSQEITEAMSSAIIRALQ